MNQTKEKIIETNSEMTNEEFFEKVKSDVTEFVECAKRCILPYNIFMYRTVLNALEMMVDRMEHEGITSVLLSKEDNYKAPQITEETKSEVKKIVKEIKDAE